MVHGSPAGWLAIDQLRSAPVGSGSSRTTSCAVPVPGSSLLLMAMVKPIWLPASTGSLSCVLVADRLGHSTVIVAVLWLLSRRSSASFDAETVAVLVSRPQSAASVDPVTWIWKPVPSAIESQWHASVP